MKDTVSATASSPVGVAAKDGARSVDRSRFSYLSRFAHAARRLARSVAERGVRTTVAAIAGALEDWWFDLRYGTHTAGRVVLDALQIPSENKARGVNYMPTHTGAFRRLIGSLGLSNDSVLVDLGCGKGKVLLLACEHRFRRVVGVEFSPELCSVARRNVSIFKTRTSTTTEIDVIESDAADYAIKDDENVFFLFNPFDAIVLGRVLQNIRASLERRHRRVWLVYNHPVCRDIIERSGVFVALGTYVYGSSEFGVYASAED